MKYLVTWTPRLTSGDEEAVARALDVFETWSPQEGDVFHQFLARVDGQGGLSIVETDDPTNVLRDASLFSPWFEFAVTPVVDIAEGAAVYRETVETRHAVS